MQIHLSLILMIKWTQIQVKGLCGIFLVLNTSNHMPILAATLLCRKATKCWHRMRWNSNNDHPIWEDPTFRNLLIAAQAIESQDHRVVWVGRSLKGLLVPTLLTWTENLPWDQVTQMPMQPGLHTPRDEDSTNLSGIKRILLNFSGGHNERQKAEDKYITLKIPDRTRKASHLMPGRLAQDGSNDWCCQFAQISLLKISLRLPGPVYCFGNS